MNSLTLEDLRMFLTFLLGPRRAQLDAIAAAQPYALALDQTLAEIDALPAETFGRTPNAEQLDVTNGLHDAHGTALFFLAQGVKASPLSSPEAKEAADLILSQYVPSRGHLRASYATEAARAERRQARLTEDKPVLDRLPVEGGTAHTWASAYVEKGIELGMLLSGRADQTGTRTDASRLRSDAITDLRVLRELVQRALRRTPDGGRAVDHALFNYLDTLAAMRDRGGQGPTPPPPDGPTPV